MAAEATASGTPRTVIVLVLVPEASCTPSHSMHLLHLLQTSGYATMKDDLASTGHYEYISIEDEIKYIHSKMLLPILEGENYNVILLTYSYSGIPGGAAAKGLSKQERANQGKTNSVIDQIHIMALVTTGGDGKSIRDLFGGQMPLHVAVDNPADMLRYPDLIPSPFHDLPWNFADTVLASCQNPFLSSWATPYPVASWIEGDDWRGCCAYIFTLKTSVFRSTYKTTYPSQVERNGARKTSILDIVLNRANLRNWPTQLESLQNIASRWDEQMIKLVVVAPA